MSCLDPEPGHFHSFAATVIQRSAISLIARRVTQKRQPDQPVRSLDAENPLANDASIGAEIANDDSDRRLGIVRREASDAWSLKEDVTTATAGLPDDLKELCGLLSCHSPIEARQILKMSEKKFSERMSLLREHFEQVGINSY